MSVRPRCSHQNTKGDEEVTVFKNNAAPNWQDGAGAKKSNRPEHSINQPHTTQLLRDNQIRRVLDFIRWCRVGKVGATDAEGATTLRMSLSSFQTYRRLLRSHGLVIPAGTRRRVGCSARHESVWTAPVPSHKGNGGEIHG